MKGSSERPAKVYGLVRKNPVARFYYQGHHSHPVRRTVLVIENLPDRIVGYELREGSTARTFPQAARSIKTYRKDRISRWGDYVRLRQSGRNIFKNPEATTLERLPLTDLIARGV